MTKETEIRARRHQLSAEQRARLRERLKGTSAVSSSAASIPRVTKGAAVMSPGQERMIFLHLLEPENTGYHIPAVLRLEGAIDVDALRRALNAVVRRHEILRTIYRIDAAGSVTPVVVEDYELGLPTVTCIDEDQALRWSALEVQHPFDLANGPVVRARLFEVHPRHHILSFTVHHIASDGWSMAVLVREVSVLYAAFTSHQPSPLPDLEVQYADFAAWQRERLSPARLDSDLAYWRKRLENVPGLELPTDRPRPRYPSGRGASVRRVLSAEAQQAVVRLREDGAATSFMVLVAALSALLARYSDQNDITVGTPVTGRTHPELEKLIGFFVNTLVMRTDLSANPSIRQLIHDTKQGALDAFSHQEMPFERLVEAMGVTRDTSRHPLFQVMLTVQNTPHVELELGDTTLTHIDAESYAARWDQAWEVWDQSDGLVVKVEYATDLFERSTVSQLIHHLDRLLCEAAAAPDRPVRDLPLLDDEERSKILVAWNDTAGPFEDEQTLHGLFERQAAQRPDAPALEYLDDGGGIGTVTYGELELVSNRVARAMQRRGVQRGDRVIVAMDRSPELVAVLLATLKVGAVYVPLEPWFPPARVASIATTVRPSLAVTDRVTRGVATEQLADTGVPLVGLDDVLRGRDDSGSSKDTWWTRSFLESLPSSSPNVSLDPSELAYVLFTSGSTGKPKGVMVQHRPAVNLVQWVNETFDVGPDDRLFFAVSISFDLSVYDVFGVLGAGGRIRIGSRAELDDADALVGILAREHITFWNSAPAALSRLVPLLGAVAGKDSAKSVRLVFLSGDWPPLTLPPDVTSAFPNARVVNLGGATETTVWSNFFPIDDGVDPAWVSIPYGRPIKNARLHVLDDRMQPCPIGVPGDLYTGDLCLALGYYSSPGLTASKFVPDPFSDVEGSRLYFTGDRARYMPSGDIEFLGRLDNQVKVRGYRIELGEIESALRAHARVKDCVVEAFGPREARHLVGYYRSVDGADIDERELRSFLSTKVPEYMVPWALMRLETFPVTPNGKLDRKSLPELEVSSTEAYTPPEGDKEQTIAGVFSEVLGVQRVSRTASFFALGGHSLLATQVVARLRERLSVDLPLRALFESPTVEALARRLGEASSSVQTAIERVDRSGELPLSFGQERMWFLHQLEPESAAYHMPAALRLKGALDVAVLQRVLAEVLRRHEALRTCFVVVDGEPRQRILESARVLLSLEDLSTPDDKTRTARLQERLAEEASRPFDLARQPPLRAALFKLSPDEHVLSFVMHHIASDGWSMGVLIREVSALYDAFTHDVSSPLPELALQYADFAAWQRARLQGERLEAEVSFWRQRLAGLEPLELPTDRPRRRDPSGRGAIVSRTLSRRAEASLEELCKDLGVTPFMVLLSTLSVVLSKYSRQDDVAIGTPNAGRVRSDLEGLIGFFVNTLVLRTDLSGDPTFAELLARVKERSLEAFAHQELPFEKLVEALSVKRDTSRHPLFDVTLTVQNTPEETLRLGEVEVAMEPSAVAAQFDLSVDVAQTRDGITVAATYAVDLFEAPTIEVMLDCLEALLEGVSGRADRPLSSLPLMRETARASLLEKWACQGSSTSDGNIVEAFAKAVARTPDAVAVRHGDAELTFSQLARHVEGWGAALEERGVRAGEPVVVLGTRSPELIAAVLGAMGAGAACVPLDPAAGEARLAAVLDQTHARFLLDPTRALAKLSPSLEAVAVIGAPSDTPLLRSGPLRASATAYVLFTSGSTGTPKGVVVSHGALFSHATSVIERYGLGSNDRVLQFASPSFDVFLEEVVPTLLAGAAVVVGPIDAPLPGAALHDLLEQHRVSVVNLPASYFDAWVGELARRPLPPPASLRMVITGSEAVSPATWRHWRSLTGRRIRTLNGYGPTEATITSLVFEADDDEDMGATVPIGGPLPFARAYVVDSKTLQPMPEGAPGELLLAGACLADGYLDDAPATAAAFIPDPFRPQGRAYRTGDVVRRRPTGALEYLGRLDQQVKVRGYRIELGEIETALLSHGSVVEAVALVRKDLPGGDGLAAYVIPSDGGHVDEAALRAHLAERLPAYMVPAFIVPLAALPRLTSGKLDRKSLPTPEASSPEAYVEPQGELEHTVAGVFGEVLGIERPSRTASFFALGGHSLLATQVVARLRERLSVDLPLRALFECPTVEELARRLEGASSSVQTAIERVDRSGELPLSFGQERMWFLHQLEPESAAYHMSAAFRLTGALDVAVLQRVLTEVHRRHEALRTCFSVVHGRPRPVILENVRIDLVVEDLSPLVDVERSARVEQRLREEASRPFDLVRELPMRAALLKLSDDEHVLSFVMHHIASDGWSMAVLTHEVTSLYASFSRGEPSSLPDLQLQYVDFAAWQRSWLAGDQLHKQLSYWKEALAGIGPLDLPTDKPRPRVRSGRGASVSHLIDRGLLDELTRLGREEGATLFMCLLAALDVVLSRYTGQTDIAVGTPIANRARTAMDGAIGFFVNTLVMRADLSGRPTFRELLRRVKDVSLAAYAHQEVPFEKLAEVLSPERDTSRTPLFQVMLVLQNVSSSTVQLEGVTVTPVEIRTETAAFDLTLSCEETAEGLKVDAEYSTDLFESATVSRLLWHLEKLLQEAVASPDTSAARLQLMEPAERAHVVVEWNDTSAPYPADKTVVDLFSERAERSPDAVAVRQGTATMSYGQLHQRSDAVARRLLERGVIADARVGLLLERGPELVVAILGVLKAGAAYLPLDRTLPRDRLAYMTTNSGVTVVVTAAPWRELAGELGAPSVALIEDMNSEESGQAFHSRARPHNLAYVIYTSGSTGRPKGVEIEHGGLTNYLSWAIDAYGAGEGSGSLVHSPLGFDLTVTSLFAPLLSGTGVELIEESAGVEGLVSTLASSSALSLLKITPAHVESLARLSVPEALEGKVHCYVIGGEQLYMEGLEVLRRRAPSSRLINEYGPTETVVGCCVYEVRREDPATGVVPIGRPISNTQLYLLDDELEPVPAGVPGELFIGGDGVARGYAGASAMTAERFVPDPFSTRPGRRLYRTGDLARLRADGNLEFLGRLDDQVKIRGYRIELGEIESCLLEHESVQNAVVLARHDMPGGPTLVAYVSGGGAALQPSALKAHVASRLPGYMSPSFVVVLDELPLTTNGKVDRRRLPLPEAEQAEYVEPRTENERTVASLFVEVLGKGTVGATDDFFALGGHSLLATQVISRLREHLSIELPLRALFEAPTVEALARRLAEAPASVETRIVRLDHDGAVPLSFGQERMWFLHQLDPASAADNMPGALQLNGALNNALLERVLQEVVTRHEVLRTCFPVVGGRPRPMVLEDARVTLPVEDLSALEEDERAALVEKRLRAEASRPFDLAKELPIRATLLRLSEHEHILSFVVHHIASDGWSTGLLIREVSALYDAFTRGEPSPLPPLEIHYADYAAWQRARLQGERLESEIAFWRDQLAGLAPLELPTDRPRPRYPSGRGERVAHVLSRAASEALDEVCVTHGVTPFMALLSTLSIVLSKHSRQDDVAIGTPIAGRVRPELESLIGFFVNTLVMRTDLSGEPTFAELLRRVKDRSLEVFAHQEVPFEKLVESLGVERDMSRHPLFQVMLVVQNAPEGQLRLGELEASPVEDGSRVAKFDLTWELQSAAGGHEHTLRVEYATDLFEKETVQRMVLHAERVLIAAARDASTVVKAVELTDELERADLLRLAEGAAPPRLTVDGTALSLFESRAKETPDAVALEWSDGALSYAQVEETASRLATWLRARGVGEERLIGVCLPRSAEMVLVKLAVWKAGAAFVSLDPEMAPDRLRHIVDEGQLAMLFGAPSLREHVGETVDVIKSDEILSLATRHEPLAASGPTTSAALAYVIYTSGSTGRPKGVQTQHDTLVNLLSWHQAAFPVATGDRTALLAGVSFDAVELETWPALCAGGTLLFVDDETRSEPAELALWLQQQQVTQQFAVTPLAEALLAEPWPADGSLRVLRTGGDRLRRRPPATLPFRLHNLYGPTECTIAATAGVVEPGEDGAAVGIGRPIDNTQSYVLDENMRLLPVGVAGELYIGGDGVGRGYLKDPAQTAGAFVPDPFRGDGARLYKTGDLVRWRMDSTLEFLGRIDHQVKIRGYRIELGEIESVLVAQPEVSEAVVVERDDLPGGRALVAYVVATSISEAALVERLKSALPSYMIPPWWMRLDELPRLASGKLDRRSLPLPAHEATDDFIAPEGEAEGIVADAFAAVLGLERVSRDASFFALGGHSLLATQVISRLRERLSVQLPLRALFESPTVSELARRLRETTTPRHGEIPRTDRHTTLLASFSQEQMWRWQAEEPDSAKYNIATALRIEGDIDVDALMRSFSELVRRHEVLRTTFVLVEGRLLQVIHPDLVVALPIEDLTTRDASERAQQLDLELQREELLPFDLSRDAPMRARLFKVGTREHVLSVVQHHIASDAWSIGIWSRELLALYAAFARGEGSPLPQLDVQYADYAAWQHQQWREGHFEASMSYWRRTLEDFPPVRLSRQEGAGDEGIGDEGIGDEAVTLGADEVVALRRLANEHEVTPFMLFLAAYAGALSAVTGQDDITIAAAVANRGHPQVQGLLGFFVNTVLMRLKLDAGASLSTLLRETREIALRAAEHEHAPIDRVVDELRAKRPDVGSLIYNAYINVLQDDGDLAESSEDLRMETLQRETPRPPQFNLAFKVFLGATATVRLIYRPAAVEADTARRILEHIVAIVRQLIADPAAPLSEARSDDV